MWETTRCASKHRIAENVYELRLAKPRGFAFLPGQFLLVQVPLRHDPRDLQPRAYSIASTPAEPDLRLAIKLVPGGRASRWVRDDLEPGSPVVMRGPFGRFTVSDDPFPILFVATGTGLAPFRSQILSMLANHADNRPIVLVAGAVSRSGFFWGHEWQQWERMHPNLQVHASFLSGEADWHGETGTVQERLERLLPPGGNVSVYACGAVDMVESVKTLCLRRGIPTARIHTERYI